LPTVSAATYDCDGHSLLVIVYIRLDMEVIALLQ
jgi:hypothetical protein